MGKWRLIVYLVLQFELLCALVLSGSDESLKSSIHRSTVRGSVASAPDTFHDPEPQPYLPPLAPSPLVPSVNSSIPELSGLCELNFPALGSIIERTATNCWDSFGSYLANVLCCPQLDATITILVGLWSKASGELILNKTHSRHCLSDLGRILESQGAYGKLDEMCSTSSSGINGTSCPITRVNEFEDIVDSYKLLNACGNIDLGTECCKRACQNAILNASMELVSHGSTSLNGNVMLELSNISRSCETVVMGWLTSKLDPSSANSLLRGISSCKMNSVCPLKLPDVSNATLECKNVTRNQTVCCTTMNLYMSKLQNQSFITTSQASNCAAFLGLKLQKADVTDNVYDLCNISLKDFSLQDSGCLLPSLPSDAFYDQASGFGFVCDQNHNLTDPWPSDAYSPSFSCIRGAQLPSSDHTSASAHTGSHVRQLKVSLICLILAVIHLLLSFWPQFGNQMDPEFS